MGKNRAFWHLKIALKMAFDITWKIGSTNVISPPCSMFDTLQNELTGNIWNYPASELISYCLGNPCNCSWIAWIVSIEDLNDITGEKCFWWLLENLPRWRSVGTISPLPPRGSGQRLPVMSSRIIPAMYSGACALFHFLRVVFFKYLVRMACCGLVSSLRPEGGSENSAPVVGTYILAGFLF